MLSCYYPDFQHAKEGAESALLFCVFAITCTGNTHNYHLRPRIIHRYILYVYKKGSLVKVGKNLHSTYSTMVRLQLILFSKITGAFLFRRFGGFLDVAPYN